ncbi:MAG: response regulator [Bacteroidota bacterium]
MKKKILVIEDNQDVRENIVEILELSNYTVTEAEDGKQGVKSAKSDLPDLILCDIMMPEMDGYEVLYMLGKDDKTDAIPFIFLTAKAEKEDFRQGMSLGADDYLTKPFDDMELLSAIEKRLTKYEKFRQLNPGSQPEALLEGIHVERHDVSTAAKQERSYKKHDVIYREGDFPHYLYYVTSGKVKIYKISEDGKEFILDVLNDGNYFGYQSLLQDKNQTEFAEAMEATTLKLISRDDFQKLMYSDKEISRIFVKMLANDVVEKEKELLHLAYDTVRKRVADNLLKLDDAYENTQFKVARNDLAGMVGTATESVIRILSEFKKEGMIAIESSGIKVMDRDRLHAIRW